MKQFLTIAGMRIFATVCLLQVAGALPAQQPAVLEEQPRTIQKTTKPPAPAGYAYNDYGQIQKITDNAGNSSVVDRTIVVDNTPAGETGVLTAKGKRRDWTIYPNLIYQVSDRTRLEARLDAGQVSYDTNLSFRRVGYQSGTIEGSLVYRMSRRFELVAGPYVSQYESDDDRNQTDSYGLVLGTGYAPAESAFVIARLRAERAEVESNAALTGVTTSDTQNSVGFEVVGHYSWPASRVRYNLGRFLEPSTIGSRVKNDVLRVQYTRSLSTRTTVIAAVRYNRENRIEDLAGETTNEQSSLDLWTSY